jgi:addiction module HigA family antidote
MPNPESPQGMPEAKLRMNRTAIHPGAILQEEFLVPLGISASKLAQSTGIPDAVMNAIVAGKTGITEDIASLLATKLNTSSRFWMNLQEHYEARQKDLAELTSEAQKLGLGY